MTMRLQPVEGMNSTMVVLAASGHDIGAVWKCYDGKWTGVTFWFGNGGDLVSINAPTAEDAAERVYQWQRDRKVVVD